MKVLLIGGTGLISTGIVKHLFARNAEVTMFNRGERENTLPAGVKVIRGDRNDAASLGKCNDDKFDVVIDMICFSPQQAKVTIDTFKGRCDHIIFCSTVCTYGVKIPGNVLIDETFPQEPISEYGRNKVACEKLFLDAHARKDFNVTIIRPSHTYGPGSGMIDNLEPDSVAWDRIEKGLPVLCAGDGLGLWVSTHRDDCGKLFAYAAQNKKTYGQAYNATRDQVFTWRDYYNQGAAALGKTADIVYLPAETIVKADPRRFGLLREITQFHGAYTSAKAKRDVPEFDCQIAFIDGIRETLKDARRRNAWKDGSDDAVYNRLVTIAEEL